jgi:hypothetical protein
VTSRVGQQVVDTDREDVGAIGEAVSEIEQVGAEVPATTTRW